MQAFICRLFKTRFVVILFMLCLLQCTDKESSMSPIINSEQWQISVPGSENTAEINIYSHEDGSITCSGSWEYAFYNSEISCEIMTGTVQKDITHLVLSCTGEAAYPPDSSGYVESAEFSLFWDGYFEEGHCSGTWEISFADSSWDGWAPLPGQFTGNLVEGEGVTD
jgi:hypothetical protein